MLEYLTYRTLVYCGAATGINLQPYLQLPDPCYAAKIWLMAATHPPLVNGTHPNFPARVATCEYQELVEVDFPQVLAYLPHEDSFWFICTRGILYEYHISPGGPWLSRYLDDTRVSFLAPTELGFLQVRFENGDHIFVAEGENPQPNGHCYDYCDCGYGCQSSDEFPFTESSSAFIFLYTRGNTTSGTCSR